MYFNSITFLIFFIFVFSIYWTISRKYRPTLLVLFSCIFYGFWRWEFLFLIFFSAILDFLIAKKIENSKEDFNRKLYVTISITINLLLLGFFKYTYFIIDSISVFTNYSSGDFQLNFINIILPFGISFYTFETISYTIDVYRRLIPAEKNFVKYSLFVTFFPKLVAGPIQRTSEFLNQVNSQKSFDKNLFFLGFKRFIEGLFLKVVIADNIAPLVDSGFSMPLYSFSAIDVTTLSILFGFQIYFDFAGYSSIAIGCAYMLGFKIPENFNYPYISTSFKEFWKRWHISLSSWIRDYLYLPLLGVKVLSTTATGGIGGKIDISYKRSKTISLYTTWAIMGLWHGANWTFVIWGLIHSTLIYLERIISSNFNFKVHKIIKWSFVFFFSMISWIPFRAQNVSDTMILYSKYFSLNNYTFVILKKNDLLIALSFVLIFIITYFLKNYIDNFDINNKYKKSIYVLNILKYSIILIFVYTFLRPVEQFIYFQF